MRCKFKEKKADIELIYRTKNNIDLPMYVYLPEGNIHNSKTIIAIHGGGWNDAMETNEIWNGGWMANNAKYLAERGFIGIVISYRSLKVSNSLNVGHLIEDCIDAILYIKNHLCFVNFDNIVYIGDSAGGYLATMLGLSQDDEIRPYAVVALNPVLDNLNSKWNYGFKGCENIEKLTPKNIIGRKSAEFLFLHGTKDEIVEMESTEELNNLLNQYGHKSEFIKILDAEHAFILYDYKYSDEYVTKIMEKIIEYIK